MNTKTETEADIVDRTIRSIVKQWRGGEHIMAGKRASQFVYGANKTPNEALLERVKAEAVGIERYISAPESPVTIVTDQGGDPLSRQPENNADELSASNLSSDQAKREQNQIDAKLKPGRDRAEKAEKPEGDPTGSSRLNPAGSDQPVKARGKAPKAK